MGAIVGGARSAIAGGDFGAGAASGAISSTFQSSNSFSSINTSPVMCFVAGCGGGSPGGLSILNSFASAGTGSDGPNESGEWDLGTIVVTARRSGPGLGDRIGSAISGIYGFVQSSVRNVIIAAEKIASYAESGWVWWAYQAAVPGPFGQPISEWKSGSPTSWGDPIKYTEEAGGAWKWAERGAIGVAVGATAGAFGANAVPYWRYVGPGSNPSSGWLTRGLKPPYGNNFEAARDALQIKGRITGVERVRVPWWRPVAGPRPVQDPTGTYGNPHLGSGRGLEWYRGIRFPVNNSN